MPAPAGADGSYPTAAFTTHLIKCTAAVTLYALCDINSSDTPEHLRMTAVNCGEEKRLPTVKVGGSTIEMLNVLHFMPAPLSSGVKILIQSPASA